MKLLAWAEKHSETPGERRRLEQWKARHSELTRYVHQRQTMLWGDEREEDAEEDLITEEMLEQVEHLDREEFNVPEILNDTFGDLDQIVQFLDELRKFEPKHDDKLKALLKLLTTDRVLKKYKLLIFSEFADTARYLHCQLVDSLLAVHLARQSPQKQHSEAHRNDIFALPHHPLDHPDEPPLIVVVGMPVRHTVPAEHSGSRRKKVGRWLAHLFPRRAVAVAIGTILCQSHCWKNLPTGLPGAEDGATGGCTFRKIEESRQPVRQRSGYFRTALTSRSLCITTTWYGLPTAKATAKIGASRRQLLVLAESASLADGAKGLGLEVRRT